MCFKGAFKGTITFLLLTQSIGIHAGEILGKIEFESKRRLNHNAEAEIAVAFFRPAVAADQPGTESTDVVEMMMSMKQFNPTVIAVQTGTEVNFPNADRVIHNAFSTTKKNQFDLGFYPQGESRSHRFTEPGLVKVFCNVHQNMYGYVMVLDTPYFTKVNPDGSFTLDNLPEGLGKLFIWHPRGKTISRVIEPGTDPTSFSATMALTKRIVPKHKNKFGKPYRRNRDY